MKVLMFSLDQSLVNQGGEGDTLERLIAYGRYCRSLTVLVPTLQGKKKSVKNIRILPARGKNQFSRYLQLFRLSQTICQQQKPDLIVTNDAALGAIAVWLRKIFRVKVQISVFGLEIIDKHWLKERPQNFFFKWVQEWAMKRADGLRTDNTKEKELLIKYYGIDSQKITVIPVAPSKKSQQRFLEARSNRLMRKNLLGNHNYLVLSVGNLVKAKDFQTLVKAARMVVDKIPEAVFVIAGEGPERSKLETEVKRNKLSKNFKLVGLVAYDSLPGLFAAADVFVLSSVHEGFPRALMEAALTARPIVTTAVGGVEDLIKDGQSGLVVPVKNPQELSQAVVELLIKKTQAGEMGHSARDSARSQLDFDQAVGKLISSWRHLLNEE